MEIAEIVLGVIIAIIAFLFGIGLLRFVKAAGFVILREYNRYLEEKRK